MIVNQLGIWVHCKEQIKTIQDKVGNKKKKKFFVEVSGGLIAQFINSLLQKLLSEAVIPVMNNG